MEFDIVSMSEANQEYRRLCMANTNPEHVKHMFGSIEDQCRAHSPCLLCHERGQQCNVRELCESEGVDLLVAGSPCDPFSKMRAKRFACGTLKQHVSYGITMDAMVESFLCHKPKVAIMEQVAGFTMTSGAGSSDTPFSRFMAAFSDAQTRAAEPGYFVAKFMLDATLWVKISRMLGAALWRASWLNLLCQQPRKASRHDKQADEQAEQAEESEPVPSMHDLRSQSLQKQRQEDVGLKEVFGPMRFLKNVGSTFQRVVSEAFVCCVDSLLRAPRTRAILKADAGADAKSKSVPKEEPQTLAPRSVHSIIYGKALTMSASALTGLDKGSAQEISKSTVQSRMVHAGALALEMSAVMCSSALSSVIEACSKVPNMKPLLFLWRVRYDETPSRVRVANLAEPAGSARVGLHSGSADAAEAAAEAQHGQCIVLPVTCKTPLAIESFLSSLGIAAPAESVTHAKVLQTEVEVMLVYGLESSGNNQSETEPSGSAGRARATCITCRIPTCLQAVDKTTAVNQRACIFETLNQLPEWTRLASNFKVKCRQSTCDRYSANRLTEDGLMCEGYHMQDWMLLCLPCDTHKSATCIKAVLSQSEADISGLINTALTLCDHPGVMKTLRDILIRLFFQELQIDFEEPPDDLDTRRFRSELFDMYLPLAGRWARANAKRRFILGNMLNSKLQEPELRHHCSLGARCCGGDRQQTASTFAMFVVWALLPFQMPVLCRKNWLNQVEAMQWLGLIQGHHGLFTRLMQVYLGSPAQPPVQAPPPQEADAPVAVAATDHDDEDFFASWGAALDLELQAAGPSEQPETGAAPVANADMDGNKRPVDPAQAADAKDEHEAWLEMKRKRRQTAEAFALSDPLPRLSVMHEATTPLQGLTAAFLRLSSHKWECKQAALQAAGLPRSFMLLEAARGTDVTSVFKEFLQILWSDPKAIMAEKCGCSLRTLRFSMVASGLCSLHSLLRRARSSLPYQAFQLVAEDLDEGELRRYAEELAGTPPCLRDEFCSAFLKLFPTPAELCSDEARAILQSIAAVAMTDIASIETSHSSTREFTSLRARGWTASLEEVSSRFVILQLKRAVGETHRAGHNRSFQEQRGRKSNSNKTDKKQRACFAWNAFQHDRLEPGRPFSPADISRLSHEWRTMSREDKQKYFDAAAGANLAREHGFPKFGQKKSNKLPWNRGMLAGPTSSKPMLLPGDETSDGAIVGQDAELDFWSVESTQAVAHLRESFAERYEAFVSQQPKAQDPLDLTEEEEQQLKTFHENLDADAADVASLVKACEKFDSALLQGIKAHPVSPLVRRAVWNPPAGKAVEVREGSKPDLWFFWQNLLPWLRKTLRKSKQDTPKARELMQDKMLVFGFYAAPAWDVDGSPREPDLPEGGGPAPAVFMYPAHMNYSTFHFTCLQLFDDLDEKLKIPAAELPQFPGVIQLGVQGLAETDESYGVLTDFEFVRKNMDLAHAWQLRIFSISLQEPHWQTFDASSCVVPVIDAHELCEVDPVWVWHGSDYELAARGQKKAAAAARGKKRDANGDPKPRPPMLRVRGKQAAANQPISKRAKTAETSESADQAVSQAEQVAASSAGMPADDDRPLGSVVPADQDATALPPEVAFRNHGGLYDDVEEKSDADAASEAAASAAAVDEDDDGGGVGDIDPGSDDAASLDPEQEQAEEAAAADDFASLFEDLLPSSSAAGPDAAAAAVSDPAAAGAEVGGDRGGPVAQRRLDLQKTVIQIPHLGRIVHIQEDNVLVAFCGNPTHDDCKLTRTLNAGVNFSSTRSTVAGRGRPIGRLMAWLRQQFDHKTKSDHVHCRVTHEMRLQGRADFADLPNARAFLDLERPLREDEPEEPLAILIELESDWLECQCYLVFFRKNVFDREHVSMYKRSVEVSSLCKPWTSMECLNFRNIAPNKRIGELLDLAVIRYVGPQKACTLGSTELRQACAELFTDTSQNPARFPHTSDEGLARCLTSSSIVYSYHADRLVLPLEHMLWQGHEMEVKIPEGMSQKNLRDVAGQGMHLPCLACLVAVLQYTGNFESQMGV
ncbi:unnamed protein product [Symbiodinium sp. KB8]|nr:unnamed protein product [Symbiodinium sp. KB8]